MSEKIPENMPDNCKASFWDSKVPFLATFLLDRKQLVWDLALFLCWKPTLRPNNEF